MNPSPPNSPYKFFAVAAVGTFMGTLEGSILNVALPTIAAQFGVPIDQIAWLVLAYSITLVSLMMVFGGWAARTGYGFAYRFGFGLFIAGTVICIFSQGFYPLVAGRVVQAVGSAMCQAIGMGLITAVFPPEQRGRGIGLMAMIVAAGLMTGPPIGGFLLEFWPWQSIFIASLPASVLGLGLSLWVFRDFEAEVSQRKVNVLSAATLSTALLAGMLWLSFTDEYELTDWRMVLLLAVGAAATGLFYRSEKFSRAPLIGLELLGNRDFMTAVVSMFLMFSGLAGITIMMPFYLQDVRGFVPHEIGLFLIIFPATMALAAPLSGRLSDRWGYRVLTSLGMVVILIGLLILMNLDVSSSIAFIAIGFTSIGIGVGIFNSPNTSALMGAVQARQRSIASGITSTTRVIGMATGIALSTALFSLYQAKFGGLGGEDVAFVASLREVFMLTLVPTVIGLILCLSRRNRVQTAP